MGDKTYNEVSEYYGKTLQGSEDLKTNACCTDTDLPEHVKTNLSNIHDEVMIRYYGCGLVAPQVLKGARILDLGSGSGRDVYALAQEVGEHGSVVGVDMTDEQLEVANRHIEYHRDKFGYAKANTEFHKGYIEKLDELDLELESFDVVISNCVINLSPDKEAVLKQVWNLLKPGGEMYFSDVYSDRRVPVGLVKDPVLYGECLSGALYWNDFLTLAKDAGFTDPRLVEDRPLVIDNAAIEAKVSPIDFFSATYRLFKIEGLDSSCEDYGQAVIYKGSAPQHSERFALDAHHSIEKGRVFPVCRNTYRMLNESRFAEHFEFIGTGENHFGIFPECGELMPFSSFKSDSALRSTDSVGCC
jgi:arsenite methyltransferase